MDAIKNLIEWVANDSGSAVATLFPYLLVGIAALYLLWLVVGYLRVSQVALEQDGPAAQPVLALPAADEGGATVTPRGVPYCPVDGLQYPAGARFCVRCESELNLLCANCGTQILAAAESCYRCGTRATTLPAEH